jgi:hypothetical protein
MSESATVVDLGRALMRGAMIEFAKWMGVGVLVVFAFNLADDRFHIISRDDTDGPVTRSGLRPLVDHRTGCQYLVSRDGGLIQRMGRDGRQICGDPA